MRFVLFGGVMVIGACSGAADTRAATGIGPIPFTGDGSGLVLRRAGFLNLGPRPLGGAPRLRIADDRIEPQVRACAGALCLTGGWTP